MLKPQTTDDIGITANKIDTSDSNLGRRRSPFINFFVSFWARIKFLFTSTLGDVCDCSVSSKSRPSNCDSSIRGDEDCAEATSSQLNISPSNVTDQEPSKCVLLHTIAEEGSDDLRCEQSSAPQSSEAAVSLLLRESSQHLRNSYDTLETSESITEEHLEPVEFMDEGPFLTAVTFAHPVMMASVAPRAHFSKVIQVAKKLHVFEVPPIVEEEVGVEDDYLAESVCSSSEVLNDAKCSRPLTILGRLHTKFQNGDLTTEEYDRLATSIITSTIPRNLSDSTETRKPLGANQLYAWQLPPPLPERDPAEEALPHSRHAVIDAQNPGFFVDLVISDAVTKVSHGSGRDYTEEKSVVPRPSSVDQVDNCLLAVEDPFRISFSLPCDISYDGLQTASLDRIRSPTASSCNKVIRSKRSSSLKSERSPDDTPCRKIVRFADSLGLDLATVRQVKDTDHPPLIPASATFDLNLDTEKSFSSLGAKQFQICFPQPGASPIFMHRVLSSYVCLENARVDSSRGLLTGTIRVKSVGFEKKVTVRITYDNWSTFFEIPASYVQDSHDGTTDRFSFCAVFPSSMVANDRAQFAIRYETHSGGTYWDNNLGENYIIHCYAKATDMAGDGSWIHYL
ncbi:Glycogen-binding subunit 76A [Echinococcus granulosus]|uniref:CBM21 domain-containing protein n=1 Tax=Echinococcus granulosus TaxID=6210 RepID=U6JFT3_ECHGR|nr:CBM21 domain-containing protein [Echinococcus granulosus]EUB56671.1 CBM21 domain-containing protein [Echinococcus granulosus]KAH9280559.1 Glycogen-binding subunit 76A [Echinococcus granulosus]CDS22947.1 phosphatase regulatory subunit [Echinococcus granulosus]